MVTRYEVCPADEFRPGERRIVDADGVSVGVFNVDGEYHALHNRCPHQGAPLAQGVLTGLTTAESVGDYCHERDGEILRCPWHGWEFDVTDGRSVFNPHQVRTMSFDVEVESASGSGGEVATTGPGGETEAATETPCEGCTDADGVETFEATVEDEVVVVYV